MFKNSISQEELDGLGYVSFPGQIIVIEKEGEAFQAALSYLRKQRVLGFDTETRPSFAPHAPRHEVALLQLSGEKRAFLFKINKLGMRPELCEILANPRIKKIGAAVLDDIRGLQRRMDFKPAGFIDLQKIVGDWGINDKSVKKMAAIVLGQKVSKAQQLSNWEADNFTEAQQLYAATDAWVCIQIYNKLISTEKL